MSTSEDGLSIFAQACRDLKVDALALIEATARWVAPETYNYLPIWYPEAARGRPLYKANWVDRSTNTSQSTGQTTEKFETNGRGQTALLKALGQNLGDGWTCCHIWGFDDPKFNTGSVIVRNPKYYTCVANMIWLPTPAKALTDSIPEVQYALRFCTYHLYGFLCREPETNAITKRILAGEMPRNYPGSWPCPERPKARPLGTSVFTAKVKKAADKRLAEIAADLTNPKLKFYPQDVLNVLAFHNVDLNTKRVA